MVGVRGRIIRVGVEANIRVAAPNMLGAPVRDLGVIFIISWYLVSTIEFHWLSMRLYQTFFDSQMH
jgi:hypothetical protein